MNVSVEGLKRRSFDGWQRPAAAAAGRTWFQAAGMQEFSASLPTAVLASIQQSAVPMFSVAAAVSAAADSDSDAAEQPLPLPPLCDSQAGASAWPATDPRPQVPDRTAALSPASLLSELLRVMDLQICVHALPSSFSVRSPHHQHASE